MDGQATAVNQAPFQDAASETTFLVGTAVAKPGAMQRHRDQATGCPSGRRLFETDAPPPRPDEQGSGKQTTTSPQQRRAAPAPTELPVAWLNRSLIRRNRFELLQKWEGSVLRVEEGTFVARLTDLTDPTRPDEEATFDLREVSDADAPLLEPGAVFYLCIGYDVSVAGQKTRAAQFRFRRLPAWSRAAIARIEARTAEVLDVFAHFE